jgi:uncharacterized membrane protein YjjB (DUF3815 family)
MVNVILSFFGSLCPAVIINVRPNRAVWAGFSGVAGWLVYNAVIMSDRNQVILATFAGALSVGIYSEIMARVLKCPATIFSIPGIFPLVPGVGAYMTVRYIAGGTLDQASVQAVQTIASAGAIALGIMLASAVFRLAKEFVKKYSKKEYS